MTDQLVSLRPMETSMFITVNCTEGSNETICYQ